MKKILVLLLAFSSFTMAQFMPPNQDEGNLQSGLGMSWIDGKPHYTFNFMPEVAFANFGLGLNLNLEFDSKGNLREENFNEFTDYLSVIRYARYGYKGDPVYARLGALDYATLGHGSIMYLYNNSPSRDKRKVGLSFDMDFNQFGFETVYGNFAQAGVLGVRGYVRPFTFTKMGSIPVIGDLEVGGTIVNDFDDKAGVIDGELDQGNFEATEDKGSVTAVGFDIGVPVVNTDMVNLDLYFDYAKIIDYGSGQSAGLQLKLNGLGLVDLRTKFERRFNGDQYIPAYFNSMYEVKRFNFNPETGQVNSKLKTLKNTGAVGNGWYGELLVRILGTFDIIGSYQRLDKEPKSGILHLSTDVSPEGMPYVARAGYDKINIQDEADIFTLDDRSYLYAELGYKPMQYILVSMVYHWTFRPVRDADDAIVDYKPQKRVEPRVSFVYPLKF